MIWLHAAADAMLGMAHYSTPLAQPSFQRHRTIIFGWLFASFTVACGGTSHFLSIVTLWQPSYGLEGAVTALLSAGAAMLLWRLLTRASVSSSRDGMPEIAVALTHQIAGRGEMAAHIKEDNSLKTIPTMSDAEADVVKSVNYFPLTKVKLLRQKQ